jgi:hypothetical protein
MPIRNPFTRRPGAPAVNDENLQPGSGSPNGVSPPGFERVDTVGSKASSVLSIRSSKGQDNGEYKMSGTLRLVSNLSGGSCEARLGREIIGVSHLAVTLNSSTSQPRDPSQDHFPANS